MTEPRFTTPRPALVGEKTAPAETVLNGDGTLFIDFGKAVFGTLLIPVPEDWPDDGIVVHLGEKLNDTGRVDRTPPGSIRYKRVEQNVVPGTVCRIAIPPDDRNTGPSAIKMPPDIGEVLPFRYAEIENAETVAPETVRQTFVHSPFDDTASALQSSDPVLNAVWDLCKHSIKATTFCGVYVDGDRERIPYEGDAYINQLSHYGVDSEYTLARYTHEYLIQHPTWPTEWHLHSVMMAWADYMYTGETESLRVFYDDLCAKTLIGLARPDGLISTQSDLCTEDFEKRLHLHQPDSIFGGLRDLVDWPPGSFTDGGTGERDNHEMLPVNTVVNAFHCHACTLMSRAAEELGRNKDRQRFAIQAEIARNTINRILFDHDRGVYVDGEGATHASLHSNMFMLAFGLVPPERRRTVLEFVKSRGMACSVYGAQYLLEALYLNHEDQYALELMTARHDRSWWNMIRSGSTITWEAWDLKYKKNLDWNHAWGAAPANIIPRYLLGVRPLAPGFEEMLIQPQPGALEHVCGKVPTPRGPVGVDLQNGPENRFNLTVDIPPGTVATIGIPRRGEDARAVMNGSPAQATVSETTLFITNVEPGTHTVSLA